MSESRPGIQMLEVNILPCVCHAAHAAVLPMPGTMNLCGSATQDVQV